MKKKYEYTDQHYDVWLQWNLTSQCNFGGDYCFGKTPPNRQTIFSIDIDALIKTLTVTGKTFRIGFTGGEPFLIPNFVDACKELTSSHYVSFNSNLVLDDVIYFAKVINPARVFSIHASLHFKELIDKGLFRKFVHHYKLLEEAGFNIYAEAIGYPSALNKINDYKSLAVSNGINFSFAPFFGDYNNKFYPAAYTEEEINLFELDKENIWAHYQQGNICNAGYTAAVVSPTDNISPCFNVTGDLGAIYKSINLNESNITCPAAKCGCPLNYYEERGRR